MFIQRLNYFFFFVVLLSLILLGYYWYQDYRFNKEPLPLKYQQQIAYKKQQTRVLMQQNLGFDLNVPLLVSDKLPSKLYGATVFTQQGEIIIYLNKKRFQESSQYMIDNVIPHEYAHAVMFYLKDFSKKKSGHNAKWQRICKKLNGVKCDQFVDNHDILVGKTSF